MIQSADERLQHGADLPRQLVGGVALGRARRTEDRDRRADPGQRLVMSRTFPITSIPVANGPGALELTARMMRHVGPAPTRLLPPRLP